jgi:cytochrome P450
MSMPSYPFDSAPSVHPDPRLLALQADDPVARVRIPSGDEVYLVTGYEDVLTVFSDLRFSRAAGAVPGAPTLMPATQGIEAMFNMDPPDHTRLRRLVSKAFTHRSVAALAPRIVSIVDSLVDAMVDQGEPADFVSQLAAQLPVTVICEMIGIPVDERAVLYDWVATTTRAEPPSPEEMMDVAVRSSTYLLGLIDRRRHQPEDDLMTALTQVHDEGDQLTHDELVATLLLLFGTGQETTSNHLTLSVLTLLQHRDQWERLVERPDLVPNAVEELLRYVRLVETSMSRVAVADVELSGGTVPAGYTVFGVTNAANRDPSVFENPGELDIERPDATKHIAFGQGVHFCLGAPLARLELQTALTALVTRLPKLRLAVAETDLEWNTVNFTGGVRALPVTW